MLEAFESKFTCSVASAGADFETERASEERCSDKSAGILRKEKQFGLDQKVGSESNVS